MAMETVMEALARLNGSGYVDDYRAEAEGLRNRSTGAVAPPEAFEVDEIVRFEGDSDPNDEVVVFALSSESSGTRGTYVVTYGTYVDPADAEMMRRLPHAPR